MVRRPNSVVHRGWGFTDTSLHCAEILISVDERPRGSRRLIEEILTHECTGAAKIGVVFKR